ncbi:MAG: homoserine O-acetyltransferase, partial [Acidimicrobiales bacterium]|nr:homoserine O-acetyltransferase [Acidimicrobiales bacterium]
MTSSSDQRMPTGPDPALRRAHESLLAASGAWRVGDPAGERHFLAFDRPFALEGGGVLPDAVLAYETWGTLAPDADNAILVCHALTGDSHVVGGLEPGHPTSGWWTGLVGPGQAI